ncbi:substrate-binding periplasmic protein [Massilia sp. TWR1-2-2]|uniref:substrate-binding periplasmic protein n=1 Tax=Massilia sp. TWR1-2-2 TaxID=2804584 RepID=UPI003CE67AC8
MSFHFRTALCLALLLPLSLRAAELVILVDTATEMPMARFRNFQLIEGMHKDVGEALAGALGREPRFVALPRKRIVGALSSGMADVLCGYIPEWLDGTFPWSQPFVPLVEVVITSRAFPRARLLADLRGEPIGTVFGYTYPDLERALGSDFVRADGPSTDLNLRKLSLGRLHHMVTSKHLIDYRMKLADPPLALHPPLVVKHYLTGCALSPKGAVSPAQMERAVAQLQRDGTITAIMARYQ